jgi:hypothetical protein
MTGEEILYIIVNLDCDVAVCVDGAMVEVM